MKKDKFEQKMARDGRVKVRWKQKTHYIVDHYTDPQGNIVGVVARFPANGGIAFGNNVPIEDLEEEA